MQGSKNLMGLVVLDVGAYLVQAMSSCVMPGLDNAIVTLRLIGGEALLKLLV